MRVDCEKPSRKFCSRGGKDGMLTRNCYPFVGNATGTGEDAVVPAEPPVT